MSKKHFVVISGVSGAGKSTALNAFEDAGYFCIDNLPHELIKSLVELLCSKNDQGQNAASHSKYALKVDCRDESFFEQIKESGSLLKKSGWRISLLYLECDNEVVTRRFKETRRPHPLHVYGSSAKGVVEALSLERSWLTDYRNSSDLVINTTGFSPHDLRASIEAYLDHKRALEINVMSFGFKHGLPNNADLVIDVRFLPNPYFDTKLKEKTGLDKEVRDYVLSATDAIDFLGHFKKLLNFLIPKYVEEGKRNLTIAIGCTGGKHRSVALAQKLSSLIESENNNISVTHRDIKL